MAEQEEQEEQEGEARIWKSSGKKILNKYRCGRESASWLSKGTKDGINWLLMELTEAQLCIF